MIEQSRSPLNQRLSSRLLALVLTLAVVGSVAWTMAGQNTVNSPAKRVLIFSGTGWFRHPEIPKTNGWVVRLLGQAGYTADISETPKDITSARLAEYRVLLLNNANALTDLLDDEQRQTIADWYKGGRGLVALHAALVHQTPWKWFTELAGCDFNSDSDFLAAKVIIDPNNKEHPSVKGFGPEFNYSADWTNHDRSVTGLPGVKVLFRVDESSFEPVRDYFKTRNGKPMGKDHPAAWLREHGGGRFFYTELGHDLRSLDTKFGRQHVIEGVRWAAGG
jgi:uncharacterized protein